MSRTAAGRARRATCDRLLAARISDLGFYARALEETRAAEFIDVDADLERSSSARRVPTRRLSPRTRSSNDLGSR